MSKRVSALVRAGAGKNNRIVEVTTTNGKGSALIDVREDEHGNLLIDVYRAERTTITTTIAAGVELRSSDLAPPVPTEERPEPPVHSDDPDDEEGADAWSGIDPK